MDKISFLIIAGVISGAASLILPFIVRKYIGIISSFILALLSVILVLWSEKYTVLTQEISSIIDTFPAVLKGAIALFVLCTAVNLIVYFVFIRKKKS